MFYEKKNKIITLKITQSFGMNNRRHTTSFNNLATSPISTPEDSQTQCGEEFECPSKKFFIPATTSNRRFTRKNNNSHQKSTSNLVKNTPIRPQKAGDRSLASVSSTQKMGNHNNSFAVDSPSPSTVSTLKGSINNQSNNIICNSSYVNLNTMLKNQNKCTSSIDLFQRNSLGGGSFRIPKTKQNSPNQSPNLSMRRNRYSRPNLLIENSQRISQEKGGSRYQSSNSKSFSLESYQNSSSATDSRIRREKQNSSHQKVKKNPIPLKKNNKNIVQNYNNLSNKNSRYVGNVAILETQLQLKEKQIEKLILDNEKITKIVEELKISQNKLKNLVQNGNKQIKQLQKRLDEQRKKYDSFEKKMGEQVKKLNKDLQISKRQFGMVKRDKQIAEKQLNSLMDRKIPKNFRQIQTCRQISQQRIIQDLKLQISKSKTQVQKDMEEVIINLRRQIVSLQEQLRSTQIVNRLMSKKSTDSDRYLEAYTAMKNQHKNAKIMIKQLSQQCEYLRKENIHMKKQIKKLTNVGHYNGKNGKSTQRSSKADKTTLQIPSDNDSLNLSISVMSK